MNGADDTEPEGSDPAANWDEKRRRWENEMRTNAKRALELLATLRPQPVEVRGRRLRGGARSRAKRGRW
jgi:hypothetical protein